jgi:hypothetical protein
VLIYRSLFPNISYSSHIAIDIKGKQILVVMKAVHFFHSLDQIVEVEAERVADVIKEAFVVALEYYVAMSVAHQFHKFP